MKVEINKAVVVDTWKRLEDMPEGVFLEYQGSPNLFVRVGDVVIGFANGSKPWKMTHQIHTLGWRVAKSGVKLTLEQE